MAAAFTAWLTTDPSALETGAIDVVVLANDEDGQSTGDPIWQAVTSVSHDSDDIEPAVKEAEELLADAGWRKVGGWEPVGTGYIVDVERS